MGIGISKALNKKLPYVGKPIGAVLQLFERQLWINSDHIVLITGDFIPYIPHCVKQEKRVSIIENWAPINELPVLPKGNEWSQKYHLDDRFCFMYSGTLGMKHNPDLLLKLAERYRNDPSIRVVVISEGPGIEYIKRKKEREALDNIVTINFQPYEMLPQVLATADVLIATLEPDASIFAVPSKVLTYLCAKRPLLLSVPENNLAARIVTRNNAGIVVSPSDTEGFIRAAERLVIDEKYRITLATNARSYAERTFDIKTICDKFEHVI